MFFNHGQDEMQHHRRHRTVQFQLIPRMLPPVRSQPLNHRCINHRFISGLTYQYTRRCRECSRRTASSTALHPPAATGWAVQAACRRPLKGQPGIRRLSCRSPVHRSVLPANIAPHVVRNRSVATALLEQGQAEKQTGSKKMRQRDSHRMDAIYRFASTSITRSPAILAGFAPIGCRPATAASHPHNAALHHATATAALPPAAQVLLFAQLLMLQIPRHCSHCSYPRATDRGCATADASGVTLCRHGLHPHAALFTNTLRGWRRQGGWRQWGGALRNRH